MDKILLGTLLVCLCCAGGAHAKVRDPAVAGTFYPANADELSAMVAAHLRDAGDIPAIDGELIALIVPHAGLVYSGGIAAHSYKLLQNSGFENVIICGPSHRFRFTGVSVYGPGIEWKTPLGILPCQDDMCNKLLKKDQGIAIVAQAHKSEHCLEVQLPYLQTVLPDCHIVPIVLGFQDKTSTEHLAEALAEVSADGKSIMVASTDWQHYRPASEGHLMDSLGIDCLEHLDIDRLEKYLKEGKVEMCGSAATIAILKAAVSRGANRVKLLKYGDSGDISGDKNAVVGYVAAAVYKSSETEDSSVPDEESSYELSDREREQLLGIARSSIREFLAGGKAPEFEVTGKLADPGAAFVTLKRDGQLRGCIGHTVAREPLYKSISGCAIQAAVADPRFSPVESEELPKLHIEISVLTPLQEVKSLDEIEVGRDGLMIFYSRSRGLLLPQVASEYGWDRITFLEQTCRKAGLPKNAYREPDAVLYRFQAIVFGEKEG